MLHLCFEVVPQHTLLAWHTLRSLLWLLFPTACSPVILCFSLAGFAGLELVEEDLKEISSWILLIKHWNSQSSHYSLRCSLETVWLPGGCSLFSRSSQESGSRLRHLPWKTIKALNREGK